MTTFKCPLCGKNFEFSPAFFSEGCTPVKKCPFCHAYVELTADEIVPEPAAKSSKATTS